MTAGELHVIPEMDPRRIAIAGWLGLTASHPFLDGLMRHIDAADQAAGFVRQVPPELDASVERHAYRSTACWHAQHEFCRKTCKFCKTGCLCPCHPEVRP